jgi:SAM-dependent methyltransferase
MPIVYEQVMPWGRSYDEYVHMFHLDEADLSKNILGCADGPAAFNAGMNRRERCSVSVDPLYSLDHAQIRRRIDQSYPTILAQTYQNRHLFRWEAIKDIDALAQLRMTAMQEFLDDYERGLAERRYVVGQLPHLPFASASFDLVICSHYLFLYSDQLDTLFHLLAIEELLRVGNEVRIFPVLDANARVSTHLAGVMQHWAASGTARLVTVDYEFQIGGNQMLVIRTR